MRADGDKGDRKKEGRKAGGGKRTYRIIYITIGEERKTRRGCKRECKWACKIEHRVLSCDNTDEEGYTRDCQVERTGRYSGGSKIGCYKIKEGLEQGLKGCKSSRSENLYVLAVSRSFSQSLWRSCWQELQICNVCESWRRDKETHGRKETGVH